MTTPWTPTSTLAQLVWAAGFTYDPDQDIILSRMGALQRSLGYAWAYDMGAPLLGMIIDAEPLYFTYAGKQWMIELWKGQYGLECGGEIGVYNRAEDWSNRWFGNRGWFSCADDADRLVLAFTLHRNGQPLLTRGPELHWWLTGFRWGVFSEPEGVTMTASVTLKDAEMRDAFCGALSTCGYSNSNTSVDNVTVKVTFAQPFTGQPIARGIGRGLAQKSNQSLVDAYAAAKGAAGLKSNDPNAITAEAFPAVFEMVKKWLASWL